MWIKGQTVQSTTEFVFQITHKSFHHRPVNQLKINDLWSDKSSLPTCSDIYMRPFYCWWVEQKSSTFFFFFYFPLPMGVRWRKLALCEEPVLYVMSQRALMSGWHFSRLGDVTHDEGLAPLWVCLGPPDMQRSSKSFVQAGSQISTILS